jgi:HSP20 family protein
MGALLPLRPFRDLERWARQYEPRLPHWFEEYTDGEQEYLPAVESYIKDGNLVVRADVPGLEQKDIEVNVLGNVLTIKGEREDKKEAKQEDYIRREFTYGKFERRMTLPEGAVTDKIKATFRNGVVEVTMPVGKELAARKVPLETEAKEKK